MTSAASKYTQDDTGEAERPMKVCAEAGRRCVRSIQQHPVLSAEWIALVDSLKQLTRLVQLEGRMPANTKVTEAHGRNKESDGTLWDQEAHENAIRILVEEAKVNLCLRMLNDYKKWQSDPQNRSSSIEECLRMGVSEAVIDQKCRQFEEALGVLLWRAFVHVETLQLMDIPLLIEHCALVLEACASAAGPETLGERAKLQETVVLYYVSSLFKHAEKLNSSELLAKTKEFRLVSLTVDHILKYGTEYTYDMTLSVAEGFAALYDNEDFSCSWESFFLDADGRPSLGAKENFLQLEDKVVKPILTAAPDLKKDLRPLTDFFKTIQRSMK